VTPTRTSVCYFFNSYLHLFCIELM
jgi:hypothetical protein